jgi:hypothetical protein
MDYLEASHRFDEDRFSKKMKSFDKWCGQDSSFLVVSQALRVCKDDDGLYVTDSEDETDAPKKIQHDGALEQMFRSRPYRVDEEAEPVKVEIPKRMSKPSLQQVKLPSPTTKQTYSAYKAEKKSKEADNTESAADSTELSHDSHDTARKVKTMDEASPKQRKLKSSKSSPDNLSKTENGVVRRPRVRREELYSNGPRPRTRQPDTAVNKKSLNDRRRDRLSQSEHRGSRRQNYEPSSIGARAERHGSVAASSGRRGAEQHGPVVPTSYGPKTERHGSSAAARARRRGLVVASSSEPKAEPCGTGAARSEPRDAITCSERPSSTALATSERRGSTASSERRSLKTRSRSTDSLNRRSSSVERSKNHGGRSSSTDKTRRKQLTRRPSRKNLVRSESNEPSIEADEQGDFSVNLRKAGRPTLPRGDSSPRLRGSRRNLMRANSSGNLSARQGSNTSLDSSFESRRSTPRSKDSKSREDPKGRREMMKRMDSVGSFFGNGRGEIGASYPSMIQKGEKTMKDSRESAGEIDSMLLNLRRNTRRGMIQKLKSTRDLMAHD